MTRTQKPFIATLRVNESRPAALGQQPEASLAWGGATLTAKRREGAAGKLAPPLLDPFRTSIPPWEVCSRTHGERRRSEELFKFPLAEIRANLRWERGIGEDVISEFLEGVPGNCELNVPNTHLNTRR